MDSHHIEKHGNTDFPEILYIMGTGRSGTTVLEVLLANNPGLTGVGEVKHIFRDGFLNNTVCSCGEPTLDCPVWSNIFSHSGFNEVNLDEIDITISSLESHAGFFLLTAGLVSKRRMEDYRSANEEIFKSVTDATNCKIIIDSSKYSGRALAMARLFPGKIKILCVTRSPGGLLTAYQKPNKVEQKPKSTFMAVIYYLYVLSCMWVVKHRYPDICLTIRFDDLRQNPVKTLDRIQEWSGYDLSEAREKLLNNDWFNVGHIVTGNRLRKNGKIQFQKADKSKNQESSKNRFVQVILSIYRYALGF